MMETRTMMTRIMMMLVMMVRLTMPMPRWEELLRPAPEWGQPEREWRAAEAAREATGAPLHNSWFTLTCLFQSSNH